MKMKKYILLAFLSVGIFGITQLAMAEKATNLKPPSAVKAEKKVEKVQATVILHKDENGKAVGYEIYGNPEVLESSAIESVNAPQESGCDGPCCVWENGSCTRCCNSNGEC